MESLRNKSHKGVREAAQDLGEADHRRVGTEAPADPTEHSGARTVPIQAGVLYHDTDQMPWERGTPREGKVAYPLPRDSHRLEVVV